MQPLEQVQREFFRALLLPLRRLSLSLLSGSRRLRRLCLGVMSVGPGQSLLHSPQ